MNDIDDQEVQELEEKYGVPEKIHFSADFLPFECELVARSASKGRNHDITCFIEDGDHYIVIQKHAYAGTGIFRAPSGGRTDNESIEEAAIREMKEETGFRVRLIDFVLDVLLEVRCPEEVIPWRSLVFRAVPEHGTMEPIDTFEIHQIRRMTKDELLGNVQGLMRKSGWGGFAYRAFLTECYFKRIDQLKKKGIGHN